MKGGMGIAEINILIIDDVHKPYVKNMTFGR